MYTIKLDNQIKIKRIGMDALEIEIGGKKARILTEDLACIVECELPEDRAKNLLSAVEEKTVSKGKMRLVLEAQRDLKKGDLIRATVDVTRYLDKVNALQENREKKSGLILPRFSGVRTNNAGFII